MAHWKVKGANFIIYVRAAVKGIHEKEKRVEKKPLNKRKSGRISLWEWQLKENPFSASLLDERGCRPRPCLLPHPLSPPPTVPQLWPHYQGGTWGTRSSTWRPEHVLC